MSIANRLFAAFLVMLMIIAAFGAILVFSGLFLVAPKLFGTLVVLFGIGFLLTYPLEKRGLIP